MSTSTAIQAGRTHGFKQKHWEFYSPLHEAEQHLLIVHRTHDRNYFLSAIFRHFRRRFEEIQNRLWVIVAD